MRVLNASAGEGGHPHGHSHSHTPLAMKSTVDDSSGISSAVNGGKQDLLKSRSKKELANGKADELEVEEEQKEISSSLPLSAYLNLFGDFSEWRGTATVRPMGFMVHPVCASPQHYGWFGKLIFMSLECTCADHHNRLCTGYGCFILCFAAIGRHLNIRHLLS